MIQRPPRPTRTDTLFPPRRSSDLQTTITKRQVNALLDFGFIDHRENVVFIGPPGVGKTHLAIGIGQKAIQAGYKVLFRTALDLVEDLELAEMKGEQIGRASCRERVCQYV